MKKNIIKLTEAQLHSVIKESMKKVLKEQAMNGLSQDEIMQLAQIVVKQYGHNNVIDLSNPEGLMRSLEYCMQSTRTSDPYEALKTMATGGGW